MAGKFSIYKYVKLEGKGWRYARAAFHSNGKIRPNIVLLKGANGKATEEKYAEGAYFLNWARALRGEILRKNERKTFIERSGAHRAHEFLAAASKARSYRKLFKVEGKEKLLGIGPPTPGCAARAARDRYLLTRAGPRERAGTAPNDLTADRYRSRWVTSPWRPTCSFTAWNPANRH